MKKTDYLKEMLFKNTIFCSIAVKIDRIILFL